MLTSLRIQNFRSIRDASVKLGQVNLFIGPNNSGKSNFLKGIELFSSSISSPNHKAYTDSEFNRILTKQGDNKAKYSEQIFIHGQTWIKTDKIVYLISKEFCKNDADTKSEIGAFNMVTEPKIIKSHPAHLSDTIPFAPYTLRNFFLNTIIYKIDPSRFLLSTKVSPDESLSESGANIVSFIHNLSQNYEPLFQQLKINLNACISDLVRVATPADPDTRGNIKLKFFDKSGRDYWAEEVSEGVLYFLALLCIVHQPDPPKLLLLEEPEKGIHPRRIKEVMDFIFELAELRSIQIIITSHSPYVVDHFADIPECISVFDRENGETVIRNAGDIINETNAELIEKGHKPISYTDSLGEYWVSGFLGGVPV